MDILGPYNYDAAVREVATWVYQKKQDIHPRELMLVGLEGLTSSGKSTFSEALEGNIRSRGLEGLQIEGDSFHQGSKKANRAIQEAIALVESGRPLPEGLIQQIWREEEIRNQIMGWCKDFNASQRERGELALHNLLKFKEEGSEHSKTYGISRDTILLLSSAYLRHIPGFDLMIYFDVFPDVSAERKVQRDKQRGIQRDPEIPRKMVKLIEYPLMLRQIERFPLDPKNSITVDINDFEKIYLKK